MGCAVAGGGDAIEVVGVVKQACSLMPSPGLLPQGWGILSNFLSEAMDVASVKLMTYSDTLVRL